MGRRGCNPAARALFLLLILSLLILLFSLWQVQPLRAAKGTRGPAVPAPTLKAPKNMERSCLTPAGAPQPPPRHPALFPAPPGWGRSRVLVLGGVFADD